MQRKFHFISGLPRSGSTLLSALLLQNPRFHAGVNSVIYQLIAALQANLSAKSEFRSFIDDTTRERVYRAVFDAYYATLNANKIVFDTNRGWCSKWSILMRLFPDAKLICCVRQPIWVLDSFERLFRHSSLQPSGIFNFEAIGNVYTRADQLNAPAGLIGSSYAGLKEVFYGEFAERIVFLTYESLTAQPKEAMASLYEFLDVPIYAHDFDNVEFQTDDYDHALGLPGLHRLRSKVEYRPRNGILPPDLFAKYNLKAFWSEPDQNPNNVRVI